MSHKSELKVACARISKLVSCIESSYLDLGAVLSSVLDRKLWRPDFRSFGGFARTFGITHRKAYALVAIHRLVVKRRIAKSDAIAMGWAKTSIIVPMLGGSDAERWVMFAKKSSVATLKRAVPERVITKNSVVQFIFNLTEEEARTLDTVLVKFGALRHGLGLRCKEAALMALVRSADQAVAHRLLKAVAVSTRLQKAA